MKKPVDIKIHQTDGNTAVLTATCDLDHLVDVYHGKVFLERAAQAMADKFVEENYHRIMNGINLEQMEADVLDLVKKKFADLLKLDTPKPTPVWIRKRNDEGPGYIMELR